MTTTSLTVFNYMQSRAAADGLVTNIPMASIHAKTGISLDAISRAVTFLRAHGAIELVKERHGQVGDRIYRIVDPSKAAIARFRGAPATPAAIKDRIRELWATDLSTKVIGDALGITKNAVVGHAHRMGLPSRASPIIRDGVSREPKPQRVRGPTLPVLASVAAEPVVPPPPVKHPVPAGGFKLLAPVKPPAFNFQAAAINRRDAPTPRPVSAEKPIVLQKNRKCQWPMWGTERPTHVYCDEPCERSWCETHHRLVFSNYHPLVEMTEERQRNWRSVKAHTPLTDIVTKAFVVEDA